MSIIRVSKRERFVVIDKTPIEDARLSFKATGLIAFLLSKPDDWTIRHRDLVTAKADGRAAVLAGLKELEEYGYLQRQKRRNADGQFVWEQVVYERPSDENRQAMVRKSTLAHGPVSGTRETGATTEEGVTEQTPPTPPQAGGVPEDPSVSDIRRVACPRCGSDPGQPCQSRRGQDRESNHQERVNAYRAAIAGAEQDRRRSSTRPDACDGRGTILDAQDLAHPCPECR
jgi:hypothetical protein